MTDHAWTEENLDAYLAGGLTAQERADLERHVADCAECAGALEQARKLETAISGLFVDAIPRVDLEDRAIAHLRRQPTAHPLWVRYVLAAAAVLVIGMVGGVVQAIALDRAQSSRTQ